MAQVALRYTVNANLIFKWLRDSKYRPKPRTASGDAGLRILPVETVKEAPVTHFQNLGVALMREHRLDEAALTGFVRDVVVPSDMRDE